MCFSPCRWTGPGTTVGTQRQASFPQPSSVCRWLLSKPCMALQATDFVLHSFPTRLSDPTPWTAHLGMYVQGNAKFVSPVKRIVVHEYYNSQTFDYDIALLQLSTAWPETLKQLIQPICIPPAGQKVRGGEKCWVTGWGRRHEAGVCTNEWAYPPLPDNTNFC